MDRGTFYALTGITVLTLPSLASQHYRQLGLNSPILSPSYVNQNLILTMANTSKINETRIISPTHTLITHMFHHKDFNHWASNTYSLLILGNSLSLGFLPTLLLFFGGGITGLAAQSLHTTLLLALDKRNSKTPPQPINASTTSSIWELITPSIDAVIDNPVTGWMVKTISGGTVHSLRERVVRICGSSAGVYALTGAELVRLIRALRSTLRRIVKSSRSKSRGGYTNTNEDDDNVEKLQRELWSLLLLAVGHGFSLGGQIAAIHEEVRGGIAYRALDSVGYAAHLGGFAFGALFSFLFL
ncbi:hypothetical protein HDU76_011796 [Blyttiomyces sp. JEL0837]|nr:hypothetical protein HDU76_011796 [Blyttiomyces sp. JEL0837]